MSEVMNIGVMNVGQSQLLALYVLGRYAYLIVVTSTTSGAGVKIFRLVSKKCEITCFGVKIMNFVFFVVKKCFWCLLKMVLVSKTSQELRMLSSVTINCQVTKIVINSGSQLSEL